MTLWRSLLNKRLASVIKTSALELTYPDGARRRYGDPAARPLKARLRNDNWTRRLVLDPELALGESYMDGGLIIADDDLYGLLDLIWENILSRKRKRSLPSFVRRLGRRVAQFNPADRARKNAAHHYDIGNDLYRLFLDEDLQYSCAYYEQPDMSLEDAQEAKRALIQKKLLLKPHHSVLEIGSGWGGLAMSIAECSGADVTSVTLSQEQLRVANMRASARELSRQTHFRLEDYRAIKGRFDRVVSVGMFEHVGVPHFQEYFNQVGRLLNDSGVALIHTIGRPKGPGATDPWTAKHIFPGGYIPALSEIMPAIERAGLILTDLEVLRLHYADTLREWRRRFTKNIEKISAKYDARFTRMWAYYLASSELSFRYGEHVVFQLQLAKRQDAAPLTRTYLAADQVKRTFEAETSRLYA